jgi:6-phosphofructokinase 2
MKIATLTLNPALDKNTWIDKLQPEKKLRCEKPQYEPGGGGLNVSRAISVMGGESLAIYAAGGSTGDKIRELLSSEGVRHQNRITIRRSTRVNLLVTERSTGNQYRFGMPGDQLEEEEVQECLDAVRNLPESIEYLVASGSLPPGSPDDLYQAVVRISAEKKLKLIIDTSGNALMKAVEAGVYLVKPNLRELSQLARKEEIAGLEQEEIATRIIEEGRAEIVVLSMGPRGAMMVTGSRTEYVVPPTVKPTSTVGAGDSMVAGIVLSLSRGDDPGTALRWGVSAGTAATMTSGSELCRKEDAERIFKWINRNEKYNPD